MAMIAVSSVVFASTACVVPPASATSLPNGGGTGAVAARAGNVRIPGDAPVDVPAHTRRATSREQREQLTITVVLNRADQAGFDAYLAAVQDPSSANYRHFLSQAQIADRFGPSLAAYDGVKAWLSSQGFTVTQGSADRLSLTAHGSRKLAEQAFDTPIRDFRLGRRTVYANLRSPAVPQLLASDVQAVIGLSDVAEPTDHNESVPDALGDCTGLIHIQLNGTGGLLWGLVQQVKVLFLLSIADLAFIGAGALFAYCSGLYLGAAWFGPGGLSGRSVRADLTPSRIGHDNPPAAQKVGLLEYDTYRPSDVTDWLNLVTGDPSLVPGITSRLTEVNVNGGVSSPGGGESEVLLDIDSVLAGAGQAVQTVVYDAPPQTSFVQIFQAMIADGDTVISNSWGRCEDQTPQAEAQAIDSVLANASASGITVVNATGDFGSSCFDGSPDTVTVPADSPHATAVGGTTPAFGPTFTYDHESWWDDQSATPPGGAGGYGVSRYFSSLPYQQTASGSAMRSVPDLSFDASPSTGIELCQADAGGCPDGSTYGGTSMAAPEVAALVADVNERLGHNIGDLNAAAYPLAGTDAFHSAASMGSDFAHVGLGSPNFTAIYQQLAGLTTGVPSASTSIAGGLGQPQADGSQQGRVRVDLEDANGFPVAGKAVTLSPNGGSAVVSPSGATTSQLGGSAVFTVTDTTPETVTFTVEDTSDGITLDDQPTLTFSTPVATGAEIYGGPSTVANDGSSTATITVYLANKLGRPAAGKTVSISQGGGHAVVAPGTTAVTDSAGNVTFTATDTSAEAVDFTATDITDGDLPVPGGVLVNFTPGGATCDTALPTPASGYSVSPFASGFAYTAETIVYPGNFTEGACTSIESAPAFDSSGNAYVSDAADGTIHVLPAGGGPPSTANQLPSANFPGGSLGQLSFGTGGSLYAGLIQSNGSVSNPEIVQLDPITGATTRVVADKATGLPDCPFVLATDPLSGDLFTDDECSGYAASNQISRIHDPNGPNPTVSNYITTGGCNLGMQFAPDGTLFLANCNGEVDEVGGTDTANPTVTKVADAPGVFAVAVAAADSHGHATAVEAFAYSGDVTAIDLTTSPASATTAATGTSRFFISAIGTNGCGYGSIPGTIVKVGPSSCSSSTTSNGPQLTLTESSGSATPPTGSSVSFTAALSNAGDPAAAPVNFTVAGTNLATAEALADNSGQATASFSGTFQGIDTVTATAVVNGQTIRSAPLQVHWTAGKSTTFLDLNVSQLGGPVGQSATITASLFDLTQSPPTPLSGRTVTLSLGGQACQAQTDGSGVASCDLTPQSAGLLPLTASYGGDATFTRSSASNRFDATSTSARPTSTGVDCSPGSVTTGSATTCTATVTDTGTGAATTPTGTVSFTTDSSGTFGGAGSCALSGSGSTATCQQTYTPTAVGSGTHTITASYGGDAGHLSSLGTTTLSVGSGSTGGGGAGGGGGHSGLTATATSLSSSANPSGVHHSIVYLATVTPTPSSSSIPATQSSVAFVDNGQAIPGCGAVPVGATTGTARCTVSYAIAGSHRITAIFSGGGTLAGSQSPVLTETVTGAGPSTPTGTVTTLRTAVHRPVTGRRVTYTARVRPAPAGGTVRFFDDATVIRSCRIVPVQRSTGTARCHLRFVGPGVHLLQAAYSGDRHFTGSQSPALRQRVRWSVRFHGAPSAAPGAVVAAVGCAKHAAGCHVTLRLADRHHPGVVVGRRSATLAAGTTGRLVIELNRTGRRRLAAVGRLPVTVVLRLRMAGHRHTVSTRKVVVRQP